MKYALLLVAALVVGSCKGAAYPGGPEAYGVAVDAYEWLDAYLAQQCADRAVRVVHAIEDERNLSEINRRCGDLWQQCLDIDFDRRMGDCLDKSQALDDARRLLDVWRGALETDITPEVAAKHAKDAADALRALVDLARLSGAKVPDAIIVALQELSR